MRIGGVLFCVAIAVVIGGLGGSYFAIRRCNENIARFTRERDGSLIRERELRVQLEEALTARLALAQEVQQLQTSLSERLKRLEEIAARQLPARPIESNDRKEQ